MPVAVRRTARTPTNQHTTPHASISQNLSLSLSLSLSQDIGAYPSLSQDIGAFKNLSSVLSLPPAAAAGSRHCCRCRRSVLRLAGLIDDMRDRERRLLGESLLRARQPGLALLRAGAGASAAAAAALQAALATHKVLGRRGAAPSHRRWPTDEA